MLYSIDMDLRVKADLGDSNQVASTAKHNVPLGTIVRTVEAIIEDRGVVYLCRYFDSDTGLPAMMDFLEEELEVVS